MGRDVLRAVVRNLLDGLERSTEMDPLVFVHEREVGFGPCSARVDKGERVSTCVRARWLNRWYACVVQKGD